MDRLMPDRQRGWMSDAEPPMETGGNKETVPTKKAPTPPIIATVLPPETVQLCLTPVDDDQHRKDPEAESQADQTHSSRDPV